MLGFITVSEGDAEITPAGRGFVDADILQRKELFRNAALEHVVLIRQITRSLEAKANHKLTDEFFHDLLDEHFTESETMLQIETAIQWGRYSELFDHDSTGQIFLHARRDRAAVNSNVKPAPASWNAQGLSRSQITKRTWPFLMDRGGVWRADGFYFCAGCHRPLLVWRGHSGGRNLAFTARASFVRVLFAGAHDDRIPAEPDIRGGVRLCRRLQQTLAGSHARDARHSAIDSGAEFSSRRDAGDGGAVSHPADWAWSSGPSF